MIAAATFSTSVEISATEKNFYSVEKFADLEILRYKVPGFEDLTPKQKELVYYLSQAALQGRDILYDQNGKWNLAIRRTLEAVYTQYKGDRNSKDFKALETIIRETWHYDDFSTSKTAVKLARVFLSSCLTNYTFSRVAVVDGNVAGIILANNITKHKSPLSNRLLQIKSILSLYSSKEGRNVSKIFGNVNGIDKQLLNENNKTYPAELALFAVSSSCRGKGIGKMLFQSALNYMKQEKLKEFYLFTDTSCNYGFYEHQGMKRRLEKKHVFNIKGQQAVMNFFIYDYQLSN